MKAAATIPGAGLIGLRRGFIKFPHVMRALDAMGELMKTDFAGAEPDNLLLVGDTGMGKTTLLKRLSGEHPRQEHPEFTEVPVLYLSVPPKCSIKTLAGVALKEMGSPFWDKGNECDRTDHLVALLKGCCVRLVVFDEVNHLVDRGADKTHYLVGDWIKSVNDASHVPFVLAGTPRLLRLVQANEQLADRFIEVFRLTPFSMADLRMALKAFQKMLDGFPCVDLTDRDMARSFAFATDGRLRPLRQLLVRAVKIADGAGTKGITVPVLARAFREVVFSGAPDKRNPFSNKFERRPLTGPGEPYCAEKLADVPAHEVDEELA